MEIKIDTKSIDRVERNIRDTFNKVISSKALLNDIGNDVAKDIRYQTRRSKFAPLTSKWVKLRERISQANPINEAYKKMRSNLTLTGELLDSLTHKILGPGKIQLYFEGIHKPYKVPRLKSWKRKGKIVTSDRDGYYEVGGRASNQEIADALDKTRHFIKVREQMNQRIKLKVIAYIRRASRVKNLFG